MPIMRRKKPGINERGAHIIIRGLVTPTDWDDDGKVVDVSINAFDEEEYPVYLDTKGRKLISFVREEVEVKGILMGVGEKRLKVLSHNLVKEK